MRVRHRIPSIFSLSMVDMLCCCMGCIILVWLLGAKQSQDNIRDAKSELEEQKREANAELTKLNAADRRPPSQARRGDGGSRVRRRLVQRPGTEVEGGDGAGGVL